MKKIFLFFVIFLGIFLLFQTGGLKAEPTENEHPFELILNGEWELYIGDDINIKNIDYAPQGAMKKIIMPGRYHKQGYKNLTGYSWVRKKFMIDKIPNQSLGIFLGEVKSIDECYLNGLLIGKTGSMPPHMNQAYDVRRIYDVPLTILKKGVNSISIRIYEPPPQNRSGIEAQKIKIASLKKLHKEDNYKNFLAAMVAAACMILGFYFLILYKSFSRYKEVLYFGLVSSVLGVYLFFYENTKYIFFDLNFFNFFLLKKIEYAFLYMIPIFYIQFIYHLFQFKHERFLKIFLTLGYVLLTLAMAAPSSYYMLRSLWAFQPYLFFSLLYGLWGHVRFFNQNKKESFYLLIGNLFMVIFGFIDAAAVFNVHDLPKFLAYGVTGYTIMITFFLNLRLKRMDNIITNQYKSLIYLTENPVEIYDYYSLARNYYEYLMTRLDLDNFCISIFDHNKNRFSFCSNQKWNKICESSEIESIDEADFFLKEDVVKNKFAGFLAPKEKMLTMNFRLNDETRGTLAVAHKFTEDNEHIINVLRILKTEIESHILRIDYKTDLEILNTELEKKVRDRTKEIQLKNLELKRLNEMKTSFYTNMTHDIRTPLSLITIPLDKLLTQSDNLNNLQKKSIEHIKHNTYKIITMVNSLLDAAKIESKKASANFVYDDIAAFIKKISELFKDIALQKKMLFNIKIINSPILTLFDPEKIEKTLNNLLENALKYNIQNKEILIRVEKKNDKLYEIEVTDHGRGIPKTRLKHIFRKFWQHLDNKGISQTGTGLGLAIVNEFVKMHKGTIEANSVENKYTKFILKMPILKQKKLILNQASDNFYLSHQQKAKFQSDINKQNHSLNEGANITIEHLPRLLAFSEDNSIKELLSDALKDYFSVIFFRDEKSMSDYAGRNVPEFLIFYYKKINSEIVSRLNLIKNNVNVKYIPVVVLSAETDALSKKEILSMGIDDYIAHPFHPEELILKMQNLINQKGIRLELKEKYLQLNSELELAKKIQESLLPDIRLLKPEWNIGYHFNPISKLGGDFFYLEKLEDNSLAGMILDVSGHGIGPAILTILSRALLEHIIFNEGKNPARLLEILNEHIHKTVINYFLTAFAFHISADKSKITFSNAGHPPALLIQNDKIKELDNPGKLIGPFIGNFWKNKEVKFSKDSRLFLYTDGILETRSAGKKNDMYGINKLKNKIQKSFRNQNVVDDIIKDVESYKGPNNEFEDDITLLMIK
ncbi:MAG: SpoIIE family protein phosphatase [Spirochaetia bacterium]|nr:SpoIIE family protein phosphatase [Spirochaetia bacterium]